MTEHHTADLLPTIDRPCPPWCTLPKGHGWDSCTDDTVSRGHGAALDVVDLPDDYSAWSVNLYLLEAAGTPG